jgi:excisionase family DNA binding protein
VGGFYILGDAKLIAANDNEKLLTIVETAELLGVCKRTVDRHIRNGDLPYIVMGSGRQRLRRKIHPKDLENFIETRRRFDCQSTSQQRVLSTHTISRSAKFGSPVLQAALASETLRHSRNSAKSKPGSKLLH